MLKADLQWKSIVDSKSLFVRRAVQTNIKTNEQETTKQFRAQDSLAFKLKVKEINLKITRGLKTCSGIAIPKLAK